MQHLFHSWETFVREAKSASHILLLSDYDGTLTPIVGRPELAVLAPEIKDKLRALSAKKEISVGIISGRSLTQTRDMVGLEGIYYAGNHGLEIDGPGLHFVSPEAVVAQALIKDIVRRLEEQEAIDGIIVEDKGLSLSVHYRLVKEENVEKAAEIFQNVTAPLLKERKVRVTSGKKVWEVRPPIDWHKGKAVEAVRRELMKQLCVKQLLTVYMGDDVTDEDAFREVNIVQGWSIFIGRENETSSADYFLNSVSEVEAFLNRLLKIKEL